MLDHNLQIARNFTPWLEPDMERLRKELQPSRQGLEKNLSGHYDGPTDRPQSFRA